MKGINVILNYSKIFADVNYVFNVQNKINKLKFDFVPLENI